MGMAFRLTIHTQDIVTIIQNRNITCEKKETDLLTSSKYPKIRMFPQYYNFVFLPKILFL